MLTLAVVYVAYSLELSQPEGQLFESVSLAPLSGACYT